MYRSVPAEDNNAARRADLVFRGTITAIGPSPLPPESLLNWVITMRVERIIEGQFSGKEFSFRVHSPVQSGLLVGHAYRVRAKSTPAGYTVDPFQWMGQPVTQGSEDVDDRRAVAADRDRIARFLLTSGEVKVTATDLEMIKTVAANLLDKSTNVNYGRETDTAEELRRSLSLVDSEGIPRIGRWILEKRDDDLVLVRPPPHTPVMNFVLVHFLKENASWKALSLGEERVETLFKQ